MEQLAANQVVIGKEIENIINRYRNEAPEKKSVSYLESKINRLTELFEQFETNDKAIQAIDPKPITHHYFKQEYYATVSTNFKLIIEEMMDLLNHLERHRNAGKPQTPELTTAPSKGPFLEEAARLVRKQLALFNALKNIINGIITTQLQSKAYYELKLETVKRYWNQIEDQHKTICEQISDPSIYNYTEQYYLKFENQVQEVMINILQCLELLKNSNQQIRIEESTPNVTMAQSLMTLPKITLPKFDGNYLNWQQFHDLYVQMVHNQVLSNAQKMWYLKSNLTGEAERLIKHLTISDENYSTAWGILNQRYDNKRLLVTTLIDKLLSQPAISSESAVAIKHLHDTTKECLLSLENLGLKVMNYWDPFIIHIMSKKLDRNTHNLYEQSLKTPRELQKIDQLLTFLEMRFQSLEALGSKSSKSSNVQNKNFTGVLTSSTKNDGCTICKGNHAIYHCKEFLKLSPQERQKKASQLGICLNCLKKGHIAAQCSSRTCLKCNKKHNTLLHFNTPTQPTTPQSTLTANKADFEQKSYVFLGTAMATVKDQYGNDVPCRVLLDSGSQLNFISEKLKRKLNLNNVDIPMDISGIGKSSIKVSDRVNITLKSKINNYTSDIEAFVIKEIASQQPLRHIKIDNWEIPTNINLADPEFNKPRDIDLLLGAELYGELMRVGQIKFNPQLPILQNTVLGWIVLGKAVLQENDNVFCGITNAELHNQLQKFWNMEEYSESRALTPTEKKCEEYFNSTTSRDNTGRFIVSLPILSDTELLKDSQNIAFKRMLSIEKKLSKDSSLRQQYNEFLNEYLRLGHMEEIKKENIKSPNYFLPHHYVLKPDSSTTKLRVVFDASAKTNTNLSLNDLMLAGPKVQDDLISIILRFRMKRYVFTADIQKMYRQIWITEEDRDLQLIMWRNQPSEEIKYYKLCTVTYGTKSAPYLATKCLQRLSEEEGSNFPFGVKAIKDFYVDDVMTGSNNLKEAIKMQAELQALLKEGGFELHKWCANHPELIKTIPNQKRELQLLFNEKENSHVKTLGLIWHPVSDHFTVAVDFKPHDRITKRTILADTAHIYDPLGLINPIVVASKIFLQDLWKMKFDWDDELPVDLQTKWHKYIQDFPRLTSLQIPRYVIGEVDSISTQLHIFCDASERAYGAAIYVRSKDKEGRMVVRLLCAKSRVAPVKPTTLPRLELCGAKLAVDLANRTATVLNEKIDETIFWTDSQIVLSWIRGEPEKLKTFVANRVSRIHELSQQKQWRYVPTEDNPADLVSRGTSPEQLMNSRLWFNGPEFLRQSTRFWPKDKVESIRIEEEEKSIKVSLNTTLNHEAPHPLYTINHNNSFRRLQRVIAYVFKAINIMRRRHHQGEKCLTAIELDNATKEIVREVQREHFASEIKSLKKRNQVAPSSKLVSLAPFLDKQGLLRVGGRIEEANVSYDAKHPLLLPSDHFVSKLIYNYLHVLHLHAGPQALHSFVRQKFWILQGRNLSRSVVGNCVRCTRIRPQLKQQIMGNLPANRVQQARPFFKCGVDFCGPFYTHFKIRGKRPQKSYIAVFCCLATKATHLEVVSDLTTLGFIGALKRFVARRGRCQEIFCDNGTNFVGTKNQLEELQNILTDEKSIEKISNTATAHNIQFKFIPPRAPHFGGLWEAAVKSVKYLLQRSVASAALTYEELCTVTTEIEAILNSRPLTAMSSDPNDLSPITPAHFLIGEPLTSIPDPHSTMSKMSLASRWALVSQIREEFWKRWYIEYLHLLQQRAKWAREYENLLPGTLVLIKEDNQPPLKWQMGRIIETIEGPDKKVRVADVKTSTGIYRRAIHHLAPLVPDISEEQEEEQASLNQDKINMNIKDTQTTSNTQNQKKQGTKRRNNERGTMNGFKVFLLTSLILPLFSPASTAQIEICSLNNTAGVYLEKLGNTMITEGQWKIVVYYDLKAYWAALKPIEQSILLMKRLSDKIKNNDYQVEIVNEYQHQLQEIKSSNQLMISNNRTTRETRFKRSKSPLNFIGSAFHALIGVLDDDYAEQMSKTINNVQQNENHLLELIQNQTSIIETTKNIMKKSEEEKTNQMKFIQETINDVYEKLKYEDSNVKQEGVARGFNTIAILCSALIQEYRMIQRSILEIIMSTQHGEISPLILTPEQLKTQLNLIKSHLPSTAQLPFSAEEFNLVSIYQLLQVRYHLNQNYAIFVISIPLVKSITFELYKIHPLPVHINNTFVAINIPTKYVLISPHRDQFYRPTEIDMITAVQITDDLYLMQQKGPIHNKGAQDNCELELFSKLTLPSSCKVKLTQPSKIWIALNTPNHWLYSLDKEYAFTFVCQKQIIQRKLKATGLLILNDNCELKDEEIGISSAHIGKTKTVSYFQPAINLSSLELFSSTTENTLINIRSFNLTDNTKLIQELDLRINQIKTEQQHKLKELQPHDIHQFAIGYTTIGIISAVIIYLAVTYLKGRPRKIKIISTDRRKQTRPEDYNFEVKDFKRGQDVAA